MVQIFRRRDDYRQYRTTQAKKTRKRRWLCSSELLEEFPFDNAVARSAALAGIMTPVLRGTLSGAVPLFAIIATEPRSGKTYLVNLIAVIATGHIPIPTARAPKKPKKWKSGSKRQACRGDRSCT